MNMAEAGNHVKVRYVGKMENGNIFATSEDNLPLEFRVGDGTVLPGLDKAVMGMKRGEHKTVTLSPTDGFGERNPALIHEVDRKHFPPDFKIEIGMELQLPQENGSVVFIKVLQILENDKIKLDANHPLAGKTLTFDLELLQVV